MEKEESKTFFHSNWKNILLIVFSCIIVVLLMSTTCTKQKLDIANNNIAALTDTVHTYQLKNGELMYEKQGFMLEKEKLEKYLEISKSEVKDLEKKLGSALATISKLKGQIKVDTIITHDSVYLDQDSVYHNKFKYKDKWLSVDGTSTFSFKPFNANTTINNILMDVPLKVGMSTDNKWFVTSENPYVNFTSVDGVNLAPSNKKRFTLGVHVGVGPSFGYGILGTSGGTVYHGWYFGAGVNVSLGVTYKLLEF